ncbi:ribonuclease Z [Telluribacter sp. SYSU D00476]|uniref:ribonuclease Z n=1 Tax=Telluribacter sp. SYSU D00476 TaxID=2811430 RepID=UPI001FF18486|nr:ribonuclease Z [Telluribacter sp. SYSU D00476]
MTFQVTILGSGSALPQPGRHFSSQLLTVEHECFLIDCGEGTQYRLLEQKFRPSRLRAIFISHLHGDHYFGLFGLLNSLSLGSRTEELYLFGPKGLGDIITEVFRHSSTRLSYPLHYHELDADNPGPIWSTSTLTIHTVPLQHRVPCTGFLFREKSKARRIIKEKITLDMTYQHMRMLKEGRDVYDNEGNLLYPYEDYTYAPPKPRSYAYCSDTAYLPELVPYLQDVDMLYHEATFLEDLSERAKKTFHSTAAQAARIAEQARIGKLLIGHLSSRYLDSEASLQEARSIFPNTYMAAEGVTFEVLAQ